MPRAAIGPNAEAGQSQLAERASDFIEWAQLGVEPGHIVEGVIIKCECPRW
jgi:hypothetical protein